MKYYLIATLISFVLIFFAHLVRANQEGFRIFGEPIFLLSTVLSIAFGLWAIVLLTKMKKIN